MVDLADLTARLFQVFPPLPYYGLVSAHDECADGSSLRLELPGKRWDEVSAEFVRDNSLSLPLMEPNALAAFLPAWIQRSIETFDCQNLVLEFTVYFLCPGSEDEGWKEESIAKRIEVFDFPQRILVGDFLRAVMEHNDLQSYHAYAEFGLKWWRV